MRCSSLLREPLGSGRDRADFLTKPFSNKQEELLKLEAVSLGKPKVQHDAVPGSGHLVSRQRCLVGRHPERQGHLATVEAVDGRGVLQVARGGRGGNVATVPEVLCDEAQVVEGGHGRDVREDEPRHAFDHLLVVVLLAGALGRGELREALLGVEVHAVGVVRLGRAEAVAGGDDAVGRRQGRRAVLRLGAGPKAFDVGRQSVGVHRGQRRRRGTVQAVDAVDVRGWVAQPGARKNVRHLVPVLGVVAQHVTKQLYGNGIEKEWIVIKLCSN